MHLGVSSSASQVWVSAPGSSSSHPALCVFFSRGWAGGWAGGSRVEAAWKERGAEVQAGRAVGPGGRLQPESRPGSSVLPWHLIFNLH